MKLLTDNNKSEFLLLLSALFWIFSFLTSRIFSKKTPSDFSIDFFPSILFSPLISNRITFLYRSVAIINAIIILLYLKRQRSNNSLGIQVGAIYGGLVLVQAILIVATSITPQIFLDWFIRHTVFSINISGVIAQSFVIVLTIFAITFVVNRVSGDDPEVYTLGLVILVIFSLGAGTTIAGFSPIDNSKSAHYHGQIDLYINDHELNLSNEKYQYRSDIFHLENGDGESWHAHTNRITLEMALETMFFDITRNQIVFTGNSSHEQSKHSVTILVNERPKDPRTYWLEAGDQIEIRISTNT